MGGSVTSRKSRRVVRQRFQVRDIFGNLSRGGETKGRRWSSEREWCNYVVSGTSRNGLTSVFWRKSRSPTGICRCRPLRVSRSIFHPPGSSPRYFLERLEPRKGRIANYVRDRPPVCFEKGKEKGKKNCILRPFLHPSPSSNRRHFEEIASSRILSNYLKWSSRNRGYCLGLVMVNWNNFFLEYGSWIKIRSFLCISLRLFRRGKNKYSPLRACIEHVQEIKRKKERRIE